MTKITTNAVALKSFVDGSIVGRKGKALKLTKASLKRLVNSGHVAAQDSDAQVDAAERDADVKVAAALESANNKIREANEAHEFEVERLVKAAQVSKDTLKASHQETIETMQADHRRLLNAERKRADEQVELMARQLEAAGNPEAAIAALQESHAATLSGLEAEIENLKSVNQSLIAEKQAEAADEKQVDSADKEASADQSDMLSTGKPTGKPKKSAKAKK